MSAASNMTAQSKKIATPRSLIVLPVITGVKDGYLTLEPGPITSEGLVDEDGKQLWYDQLETLYRFHPEFEAASTETP